MKLLFRLETQIDRPLDTVIRLFSNRTLFPKWQPGLIDAEKLEAQPYPKYKLLYKIGRRKMTMTETILRNDLPSHYETETALKSIRNHVRHSFASIDAHHTRWTSEIEFRFKGLMVPVAWFIKDNFRQQSVIIMKNFKGFAESQINKE